MEDNRRSLSPQTRIYNELHDLVSPDQRDRLISLINSAVATDTVDDEELARQQQERLYCESLMDVDESTVEGTTAVDADAAYACQLQEEEYSRETIPPPFRRHNRGPKQNASSRFIMNPMDEFVSSDAEIAAQLQAEENQRQQRSRPRLHISSQRRMSNPTTDRTFQLDEPEIIPIPNFVRLRPERPVVRGNNNRGRNNMSSLFRVLSNHGRGNGHIQNTDQDFGPDDYENLLALDDAVKDKPLTKDQINRLPTEKFRWSANKNEEENTCSICMDQFEQNQILRRLPCLHLYHRDCIDNWLKMKNLCPVCRMPSIQ